MTQLHQMEFVPFIMDTQGGYGPAAVSFLRTLSVHSRDSSGAWSHVEVDQRLRDTLAVAIQYGNWRLIHTSFTHAAQHHSR